MPTTETGKQFLDLTRSLARDNAVDHAESWIEAIEREARDRERSRILFHFPPEYGGLWSTATIIKIIGETHG